MPHLAVPAARIRPHFGRASTKTTPTRRPPSGLQPLIFSIVLVLVAAGAFADQALRRADNDIAALRRSVATSTDASVGTDANAPR